ncbi:Oidioi.mRNA.OKI2018_I69.chr2.g5437.t1.cds [Oikopleura dioica]|uniref:Oidioi.mRNA.OKI2018_I69.chr2.g5437.t1.cds n=1 Tax=Oikopleura dioica TaxID=34765 RepID=A0ABN7T5Z4_OIKDI|nr:Oidioi.mRNA.OKI2018_I69.chr2.g5437.t1.cds [Oikopleura dioica]
MGIIQKFNEKVARDPFGKIIYLFGIAQLVLLCLSYSLNQWIEGTTRYDKVPDLNEGSCGNYCNVQIGLWEMQKESPSNGTYKRKIRSCPGEENFHLKLFLSDVETLPNDLPRVCEDCPAFDSVAAPCIRLMTPMNTITASWVLFGMAIGTSTLGLILPWIQFAGYRIRWILVAYVSIFSLVLEIMGTLTVVSAFENVVYSKTFTYRTQPVSFFESSVKHYQWSTSMMIQMSNFIVTLIFILGALVISKLRIPRKFSHKRMFKETVKAITKENAKRLQSNRKSRKSKKSYNESIKIKRISEAKRQAENARKQSIMDQEQWRNTMEEKVKSGAIQLDGEFKSAFNFPSPEGSVKTVTKSLEDSRRNFQEQISLENEALETQNSIPPIQKYADI